jgi:hydrogenase maturation protein HypF
VAARFHVSLVQSVKMIAANWKVDSIAFSGGVFQNAVLVDLLLHHLSNEYRLLFHQQLSPNDENIAFGQLIYSLNQ